MLVKVHTDIDITVFSCYRHIFQVLTFSCIDSKKLLKNLEHRCMHVVLNRNINYFYSSEEYIRKGCLKKLRHDDLK